MTELSPYVQAKIEKDQMLLNSIKSRLPELERLLFQFRSDYEDRMYRFYYQSFKVYSLQESTLQAGLLFTEIGETFGGKVCDWFQLIVAQGTGLEFAPDHNQTWLAQTRPIVEAFLHAKYFVEMMAKYGKELDSAPPILPTGWA